VFSRLRSTTVRGLVLKDTAQEDWDLASEVVSEDKVRWAIDGFGNFKAAGEDGIFPGLLQHGIEIIMGHITKFLQHVWRMVTYRLHEGQ
jgi:hypothetical protein